MILVDVYIPSINNTIDCLLDENVETELIVEELTEMITRMTKSGETQTSLTFSLYSTDQKREIQSNKSLYEAGVRDGSRLLLL